MAPYRDALENYNRATHSDALREMYDSGPVRPARIVQSLFNWRDFLSAAAMAILLAIVVPFGLLVLSVAVR